MGMSTDRQPEAKSPTTAQTEVGSEKRRTGFEVVPLMRMRPPFMSPPLVFCFKGYPVGIPCGMCKKMVRPSSRNNSQVKEDLITQLSNHYLLNFWVSESVHASFFERIPELNRPATCIVCQRTFDSISKLLKHVR